MHAIEQEMDGVMHAFQRGADYGHAKLFYSLNRIYRTGFEDAMRSVEQEWLDALASWGGAKDRIAELSAALERCADERPEQLRAVERLSSALRRVEELCRAGGTIYLANELRAVLDGEDLELKPSGDPTGSATNKAMQCGAFNQNDTADCCTLDLGHDGWHRCWKDNKLVRSWRRRAREESAA